MFRCLPSLQCRCILNEESLVKQEYVFHEGVFGRWICCVWNILIIFAQQCIVTFAINFHSSTMDGDSFNVNSKYFENTHFNITSDDINASLLTVTSGTSINASICNVAGSTIDGGIIYLNFDILNITRNGGHAERVFIISENQMSMGTTNKIPQLQSSPEWKLFEQVMTLPQNNLKLELYNYDDAYINQRGGQSDNIAKLKLLSHIFGGFESDDPILQDSYVYYLYNPSENKNYALTFDSTLKIILIFFRLQSGILLSDLERDLTFPLNNDHVNENHCASLNDFSRAPNVKLKDLYLLIGTFYFFLHIFLKY